jgi:hypothetical protein
MRGKDYAIQRHKIGKEAGKLGQFIVDQIHARLPGPPRVPSVPETRLESHKSKKSGRISRAGDGKEAPVLHACLAWLHKYGVFAYRQNTGTAWINGQPVSFGYPGSADIIGLLPTGRFLAVECKSTTGKQSEKQRKFQQKIEQNGGVYLLVRSERDLEEQWVKYCSATA